MRIVLVVVVAAKKISRNSPIHVTLHTCAHIYFQNSVSLIKPKFRFFTQAKKKKRIPEKRVKQSRFLVSLKLHYLQ